VALLFARIELRGSPSSEIYQRLHQHMSGLNWYPTISGTNPGSLQPITAALPHATYQATFAIAPTDLLQLGNSLKDGIEKNVWTKALILS
jgi:hypothetical protein